MTIGRRLQDRPVPLLFGAMAVSLAALLLFPPLLQDQTYHQFADQRKLLGIPNFWDVISNLPFVAVGAAGLWTFHRHPITIALFSGMILTGFGSSYYHWNPSDASLLWDRLPMTICFAAILAALVQERVDPKAGSLILWLLLAIGISSVFLWRWTGDLRLYAWAQFWREAGSHDGSLTCVKGDRRRPCVYCWRNHAEHLLAIHASPHPIVVSDPSRVVQEHAR